MPEFVPPELARLVDAPPEGANWVHEAKLDGYRMQLRVERGTAALRTRKGLDWSDKFKEIVTEGRALPGCMIDGEVCALENGVPNFAALQQALSEGSGDLIFFVFDLLFFEGSDYREAPLSARKSALAALIKKQRKFPHFRYVEHFATSGAEMLESACKTGLEGIVSKRIDAPYRSGRSDLWMKAKCRGGQEVVIGGWWGDQTKLRSILIGAFDGNDLVYQGRVGTGFNRENSGALLRALKPLKQSKSPFTAGVKPPRSKEINWVEPKTVAEVEFATRTSDGLLRQASFKGVREDKPARAVVIEKAMDVHEAEKRAEKENTMAHAKLAITPRARRSAEENVVAKITISNPEKILWPATKTTPAVTKLELARYYEMVAPRMLPHIAGRPISMVRAPDGINGPRLFQRHVLAGVPHVTPIKAAGIKEPYHAIDSVEGLVALAQAAVLEIHPWGCKKGDPEIPDRLIFDLDPDVELAFERVMDAAKEMRDILEACGFTPFVKTTGGKGLHVVVAIKGTPKKPPTWAEAKAFALQVAETAARNAPERYTTNMSKKKRGGRIFLDYLRNDWMATAVGPWSVRARERATIALPIAWTDVRKGLDPAAATLPDAAKFLKRADPWKDLAASAGSLEAAMKKLQKL